MVGKGSDEFLKDIVSEDVTATGKVEAKAVERADRLAAGKHARNQRTILDAQMIAKEPLEHCA
jgi:hypothetical protein